MAFRHRSFTIHVLQHIRISKSAPELCAESSDNVVPAFLPSYLAAVVARICFAHLATGSNYRIYVEDHSHLGCLRSRGLKAHLFK